MALLIRLMYCKLNYFSFVITSPKLVKSIKKFSSLGLTYKEKKVKVADSYINYLKVGNGSHHVLCMPGALGSIWTNFRPQIEGFDKDKFTVVAWDPPGYGKSRPPNREFPTNFYEKDAEAAENLMRALNINKYSLLGWSDGGKTSFIVAARFPTSVNKLVVWGAKSFILPTELEFYEKIRNVNGWSEKMLKPMVDLYGEQYFPVLLDQWVAGMCNLYKQRNGDICTAELEKIKCPTLIVHGEKDPMIDNSHVSHLHTYISNSRVLFYPDGKHNVHLKYSDDFNKRAQDFLLA